MLCGHHCYNVQTVRSPHCHTLVKTILDTFKSGIAYSLSTETLHIFHTINYNGSTEDVCKGKYMELFETGPWLAGKRKKASPVLFPLSLLKTEFKQLGLTCFIFFPARIKPVSSSTVSTQATHRPFNKAKQLFYVACSGSSQSNSIKHNVYEIQLLNIIPLEIVPFCINNSNYVHIFPGLPQMILKKSTLATLALFLVFPVLKQIILLNIHPNRKCLLQRD